MIFSADKLAGDLTYPPPGRSGARLLVGDGSCGRTVGSAQVILALRAEIAHQRLNLPVVATGCDGRCFGAVQVTLDVAGRGIEWWTHVSPDSVESILSAAVQHRSGLAPRAIDQEPFLKGQRRILLANAGSADPESLAESKGRGAYRALAEALARPPEEVIDIIEGSELGGMGGAFFPTARKWRSCALQPAPRYLVVNAEEGEPGVFKDRHLMEDHPHRLIEGALIAAYAIGASHVYIYVNGQARLSSRRVAQALNAARHEGIVGESVLGSNFTCEIEIREGAGGYVLGEESVILESIDGRRPMPRFRPPHVAEQGLWNRPTVVNNVETLSRVPLIVLGSVGLDGVPSPVEVARTKLVCVTGDVQRPGLVEVPFGTTIRDIVMGMAGGPSHGRALKAMLTGGPSGKLVPAALIDRPLTPREREVLLGSGNLIALDERRSIFDVVRRLARFNAEESCGKCTPCREGAPLLARLLDSVADVNGLERIAGDLEETSHIVQSASLCGLGKMAPNPILSTLQHFTAAEVLEAEGL